MKKVAIFVVMAVDIKIANVAQYNNIKIIIGTKQDIFITTKGNPDKEESYIKQI